MVDELFFVHAKRRTRKQKKREQKKKQMEGLDSLWERMEDPVVPKQSKKNTEDHVVDAAPVPSAHSLVL
jgi:hypothetical protein